MGGSPRVITYSPQDVALTSERLGSQNIGSGDTNRNRRPEAVANVNHETLLARILSLVLSRPGPSQQ